jgi:hypothetical protein
MDSVSTTVSKDVRFTGNEVMLGTTILEIDEDGFHHVQIDLNGLRTNTSGADSATTCNTNRFDTIVIMDVSNMGFRLVLDDIKLIPAATFTASASDILPLWRRVPLLADDLSDLKSGENRYSVLSGLQLSSAQCTTITFE